MKMNAAASPMRRALGVLARPICRQLRVGLSAHAN